MVYLKLFRTYLLIYVLFCFIALSHAYYLFKLAFRIVSNLESNLEDLAVFKYMERHRRQHTNLIDAMLHHMCRFTLCGVIG